MKTRNHFLKERKQNELISKELKKVWAALYYIEHILILASTVTGCVSISVFASLVCIPVVIASFAVGSSYCKFCSRNKNL